MSDEPRSYDQGGTFPPSVQPITNHYNAADAIAAGHRYIQDNYGPEQVLRPELIVVQRIPFKEEQ